MEDVNKENIENEISIISCEIDKIDTIIKVLQNTLIENSDYKIKDSQNLCSLLKDKVNILKQRLNKIESSFYNNQTSCR